MLICHRFTDVAELEHVWWLEIRGAIRSNMLSRDSTYAAYIVFKTTDLCGGFDYPGQDASITVAGSTSTRKVCLRNDDDEEAEDVERWLPVYAEIPVLPRERTDGWMELEMGEFCNKDGDDGEVCIRLSETTTFKRGLIVRGIEIRPKRNLNQQHCAKWVAGELEWINATGTLLDAKAL